MVAIPQVDLGVVLELQLYFRLQILVSWRKWLLQRVDFVASHPCWVPAPPQTPFSSVFRSPGIFLAGRGSPSLAQVGIIQIVLRTAPIFVMLNKNIHILTTVIGMYCCYSSRNQVFQNYVLLHDHLLDHGVKLNSVEFFVKWRIEVLKACNSKSPWFKKQICSCKDTGLLATRLNLIITLESNWSSAKVNARTYFKVYTMDFNTVT